MKKIKRFGSFALAFALMLTLFLCSSMLIYADSELSVTDTSAVTASGEDASAGDSTETEEQTDTWPVYFYASQKDTKIKVSERNYSASYEVESYITQNTEEASEETTENAEDEEYQECYVAYLAEGSYTYTATADGYYAQTCAFNVNSAGRVTPLLTACTYQKGFQIDLDTFTQSSNEGAWDGLTLDVTWFDPSETVFYISTPAQFAGLAAIVNGIYNAEITTIYDYDSNGEVVEYIPEEYAANDNAKIAAGCTTGMSASSNQVTTDDYYYSAKGYDFDGCTIYLTADLDMGGYQDEDGNWTGADYMPIGGQYQMYFYERGTGEIYVRLDNGYTLNTSRTSDGYSHVGSSFNGTLDGAGHIVYNVYCDRYSDRSYGDSASVGLIGRLGNHDSDYSTWKTKGDDGGNYPAVNPAVRNIAVDGYFHARRSTGGIVGKIGQTSASVLSDNSTGGIIENCVNFATVLNTDSKGGGGICGAAWNAGVIRNCANFGWIVKGGNHAGISGSVEIDIENCYNVGLCCQGYPYAANSFAIGVWNGGSYDLVNNYYLSTSAYWGYALSGSSDSSGFTRDLEGSIYRLTASQMKADDFITSLDGGTTNVWTKASDADAIYSFMDYDVGSMSFFPTEVSDGTDYPVPRIFTSESAPAVTQIVKTGDVEKTKYVEGQYFDASGLELWAYYEDGTKQKLYEYNDYYTYSINRALEPGDTNIDITVTVDGFSQTYTCDITVVENSIDSIEVTSQPTKLSYYAGDYFDPTGMEVQLNFTNGTCKTAVYADGIWVDSSDETTEYDIKIPLMDTPLLLGQDGSGIMVYYTYSDGVTVSAETDALSIEENIELQITSQPEDYTATAGSTAVFEVEAAGSELTYQWQYL
ncbi:MAG: hypothetical protein LIO80_11155, partial [Lachnospiraceae bacterium]|nr:hypothetical protein [Lachnospiraceae bacterium]